MKLIITENYDELSKEALKIVLETVKSNPYAILGLATGTTPLGLYKLIIDDHRRNGTDYKHIRTVNLDEYQGLSSQNNQSYAYFMRKNLFEYININQDNTYIENGIAEDEDSECSHYNEILRQLPRDLQLLGLGSNGHIAFNEPGTSFQSETHLVSLTESTVRDNSRLFSSISEVPKKAYTMGLKNIMDAKKILILASGTNKAEAVKGLVNGPITEAVPASILRLHSDCTLICDRQASLLGYVGRNAGSLPGYVKNDR